MSDDRLRELMRELQDLRHDITRHGHAAKFATNANRATLEELKALINRQDDRLRELEKREAVTLDRIDGLLAAKEEHTGKIATLTIGEAKDVAGTEKAKAQWGLYSAIAVAVLSGLASLVVQLLKTLSGGH